MVTVSIEYRLAPEHVFPAGLDDVYDATVFFLSTGAAELGVDARRVAIVGDSAGGNLATVTAQRLASDGRLPALRAQVLLYPLLQFANFQTKSYRRHDSYAGTSLLNPENIAFCYLAYLGFSDIPVSLLTRNEHVSAKVALVASRYTDMGGHYRALSVSLENANETRVRPPAPSPALSPSYAGALARLQARLLDPLVSPLMQSNLAHMPATYLVTCGFDILQDEGYWYSQRLKKAGVPVQYIHYPSGFHGMLNFQHEFALPQQAILEASQYLKRVLATVR